MIRHEFGTDLIARIMRLVGTRHILHQEPGWRRRSGHALVFGDKVRGRLVSVRLDDVPQAAECLAGGQPITPSKRPAGGWKRLISPPHNGSGPRTMQKPASSNVMSRSPTPRKQRQHQPLDAGHDATAGAARLGGNRRKEDRSSRHVMPWLRTENRLSCGDGVDRRVSVNG